MEDRPTAKQRSKPQKVKRYAVWPNAGLNGLCGNWYTLKNSWGDDMSTLDPGKIWASLSDAEAALKETNVAVGSVAFVDCNAQRDEKRIMITSDVLRVAVKTTVKSVETFRIVVLDGNVRPFGVTPFRMWSYRSVTEMIDETASRCKGDVIVAPAFKRATFDQLFITGVVKDMRDMIDDLGDEWWELCTAYELDHIKASKLRASASAEGNDRSEPAIIICCMDNGTLGYLFEIITSGEQEYEVCFQATGDHCKYVLLVGQRRKIPFRSLKNVLSYMKNNVMVRFLEKF